jgi:cytoskeletal protein CcmA (bactofilin family)
MVWEILVKEGHEMKLLRQSMDKSHRMDTTTILEGITVVGDIKGSHNLLLNGRFEGTIELTALFLVGKTGKFKGEVKAKYVIIEGEIEGKVMASEKVELRDTGKYKGEILAPSVMISDNAFFDGVVKMLKEGLERPDIPLSKSAPPSKEEKPKEFKSG